MKIVDTRGDVAFAGIKRSAGLFAELLDQVKEDDRVFHRVGADRSVIRVLLLGQM